jgi:hypothetical protein
LGHFPDPRQRRILSRLSQQAWVRQQFYEAGMASPPEGSASSCWFVLRPEDWRWLYERYRQGWHARPLVYSDLYRLAYDGGARDTPDWEPLCELVRQADAGFPETFERARQYYADQAREQAEREEAETAQVSLADEVLHLLGDSALSLLERMRLLAVVCWQREFYETRVEGAWGDLSPGMRERVLAAIEAGLNVGPASPLPQAGRWTPGTYAEGLAFLRAIETRIPLSAWLTCEVVRRWLPTGISVFPHETPVLVENCAAVDRAGTVEAVIRVVAEDLRASAGGQVAAPNVPLDLWQEPTLRQAVAGWLTDQSIPAASRAELATLLAVVLPDVVRPTAALWAGTAGDSTEEVALWQAGRNVLLALAPEEAWPLIAPDVESRGLPALLELRALFAHGYSPRTDARGWSDIVLGCVAKALASNLPPLGPDEPRPGRSHPVDELRDVFDRILYLLAIRASSEAAEALAGIYPLIPGLDELVRNWQAQRRLEDLLGALPGAEFDDVSALSLGEAVRLLDSADYRLVRSFDDLLEAVCEALEIVSRDVGDDLAMLYGPQPRARGAARAHLHEDALQTYLRRRLLDLLTTRVLAADVQPGIYREDQVRHRQRLDLRVTAPLRGTQGLAQVVIEVKWSDNAETATALVEQLGQAYLLGEGLTHGVYVVGWCGQWRSRRGVRTNRARLEAHLRRQADRLCRSAEGQGLDIRPVVIDLVWTAPRRR